jgi:hypothetical protein
MELVATKEERSVILLNKRVRGANVFFVILLIIFGFSGIMNLTYWNKELSNVLLGTTQLLLALVYAYIILTGRLEQLPFNRKVVLDASGMFIKFNAFKEGDRINWEDLLQVNFGEFKMRLQLHNGKEETYHYKAQAEISMALKSEIRSFCEARGINVTP